MTTTQLPEAQMFEPDGHLSETALACVADGEHNLVPAAAHAHLDRCEACSHRLGEAALLSMAASDLLVARAAVVAVEAPVAAPVSSSRRRPLPVAAIAAALLLALLTAGPSLLELVRGLGATVTGLVASAPFLGRVGLSLVRAPWGQASTLLAVRVVSAVVLLAIGLQVARMTSRSSSFQEGGV